MIRAMNGATWVAPFELARCADLGDVAPNPGDLMDSMVDPSADIIWESVATNVTATGKEDKQPRTPEEWAAVRRGAPNTFVLGCMPYQSYHTVERALSNATRFMQEAACDAVKPQGGKSQAHVLKALVDAGIPTASHIGLTPHTIAMFGGFRIQGRTADAAMKILEDALRSRTPAASCWNSRQCRRGSRA